MVIMANPQTALMYINSVNPLKNSYEEAGVLS